MKRLRSIITAAAAAAFLAGPAFAQTSGTTTPAEGMSATSAASGGHGSADHAFMGEMQAMQQQMSSAKMTGNADQDFVTMMKPHHQGAIAMAKTEIKYGKSAYLKKMARKIVASQSHEIKQMDMWQQKHPNS